MQQKASEPTQSAIETADASSAPDAEGKIKLAPAVQTIKPGASVTMTHKFLGNAAAGENGAIDVKLFEGYPSGTLFLNATGSEGLNVFGAQAGSRFDMTGNTEHTVRLNYRAATDGVYYVNLMLTAEPSAGETELRAHSIRVEVGDWQSAVAKQEKPNLKTNDDGQAMVIMDAEETVGE